jgi:hypothetical protein
MTCRGFIIIVPPQNDEPVDLGVFNCGTLQSMRKNGKTKPKHPRIQLLADTGGQGKLKERRIYRKRQLPFVAQPVEWLPQRRTGVLGG